MEKNSIEVLIVKTYIFNQNVKTMLHTSTHHLDAKDEAQW